TFENDNLEELNGASAIQMESNNHKELNSTSAIQMENVEHNKNNENSKNLNMQIRTDQILPLNPIIVSSENIHKDICFNTWDEIDDYFNEYGARNG
ncbi:628_t:CDS:2, partial [Racocetra fulgida]